MNSSHQGKRPCTKRTKGTVSEKTSEEQNRAKLTGKGTTKHARRGGEGHMASPLTKGCDLWGTKGL